MPSRFVFPRQLFIEKYPTHLSPHHGSRLLFSMPSRSRKKWPPSRSRKKWPPSMSRKKWSASKSSPGSNGEARSRLGFKWDKWKCSKNILLCFSLFLIVFFFLFYVFLVDLFLVFLLFYCLCYFICFLFFYFIVLYILFYFYSIVFSQYVMYH